jgi:hypothetical protein
MMRRLSWSGIAAAALLASCSGGGGNEPTFRTELDVRGASNTPCTLVLSGGNTVTFMIAAPSPAVANTSIGSRMMT